jgi:effector-binding domain-containing protein
VVYDVDIEAIPEQAVVGLRARGGLGDIGRRMAAVRRAAADSGLEADGPMMARFYEEDQSGDVDYEVCLPVLAGPDGSVPDRVGEARGELVPAHHALVTVHEGRRDAMDDAVRALWEALDALGYRASGPLTEVYVTRREDVRDEEHHLTQLRLPYAR